MTLVGDKGTYYSCGMHNLGYRDALVKGKLSANQAAAILQSFLLYTLIEKPTIKDGHTFSESATAPHYRLQSMGCTTYPKGHSFFNPYGMWRLELMHN